MVKNAKYFLGLLRSPPLFINIIHTYPIQKLRKTYLCIYPSFNLHGSYVRDWGRYIWHRLIPGAFGVLLPGPGWGPTWSPDPSPNFAPSNRKTWIRACKCIWVKTFKKECMLLLGHRSQRLQWPIVITRCPASVCPSSVRLFTFSTFFRTAWWILMKLGMDEVLKVPYKCCCFSARSVKGRIQGGAKIGHGGSPSSGNFFFRLESYSNKPNA